IAIESSSIQRCLMSAYSHLAGLFPPSGDQIWNKDIMWQPIPVETRPLKEDNKLALQKKCPRYDELFQKLLDSPMFQEEEKRNKVK
ncbi:lysosomal acid phosphatase, partial [Elysia marginata]